MRTYAFTYFGATLLTLLSTPAVIRIARRLGLVDVGGVRNVHLSPVPRTGGVVIVGAMLAMVFAVVAVDNVIGQAFRAVLPQLTALLVAGTFVAAVGLVDDIRGLRARVKVVAEVAAALAVCIAGIRIDSIVVDQWVRIDLGWMSWPITVLWIVGVTNAVNLTDGLDGLAAGISAATCGVITVLAIYTAQPVMAVLMLALLGSLTGFLKFNFHPARIFMGDCGSLFLGFILSASSVLCAMKSAALVGLALPALAMGVPIFDTLFCIIRRFLQRRSMFSPDRSHIHHRLLDSGLRHRHVVMMMYGMTLAAAGLGMVLMVTRNEETLGVLVCIVALLVVIFRATGAVRFFDVVTGVRRRFALSRQVRRDRQTCETAELCVSCAQTLDAWWVGICALAHEMDFERMSLSVDIPSGEPRRLVWQGDTEPEGGLTGVIRVARSIRACSPASSIRIEAYIPINGSLESAGRKAALLGRLLDQNRLADISAIARAA